MLFLYSGRGLQKTEWFAADTFVVIAQIHFNLPAQDRQVFDGILILAFHESIPGIAGREKDGPANNQAEQCQQQPNASPDGQIVFHQFKFMEDSR